MKTYYFIVFTLHRSLREGVEDITGFYIVKSKSYLQVPQFVEAIKFQDAIIQRDRHLVGVTGFTEVTEKYAATYSKTQYSWIDLTT